MTIGAPMKTVCMKPATASGRGGGSADGAAGAGRAAAPPSTAAPVTAGPGAPPAAAAPASAASAGRSDAISAREDRRAGGGVVLGDRDDHRQAAELIGDAQPRGGQRRGAAVSVARQRRRRRVEQEQRQRHRRRGAHADGVGVARQDRCVDVDQLARQGLLIRRHRLRHHQIRGHRRRVAQVAQPRDQQHPALHQRDRRQHQQPARPVRRRDRSRRWPRSERAWAVWHQVSLRTDAAACRARRGAARRCPRSGGRRG